jgi:hypothetical protein
MKKSTGPPLRFVALLVSGQFVFGALSGMGCFQT